MVLLDLFSGLKGRLNTKQKVDIDSPSCKLHHSLTTSILLGFCLLATSTNLFGDPIKCTHSEHAKMKDDVVNVYCWVHSTFTLPGYRKSSFAPYPGVAPPRMDDERVYHAYYQWVPFTLFLQALMFYLPHWIWKTWEGGKVSAASMDLMSPVINKEDRKDKILLLAEYLHSSLHHHNLYALKFLFCEMLNLIITVLNIHFMNKFLGGKFMSYGTEVFAFTQVDSEERTDPMNQLFPRMTKCTFKVYGPSGTPEKLDSLCVLPHNILNEKVYLFLWVWFWILVVVGSLAFVFRCLVIFVPFIRLHLLASYTQGLTSNEVKTLTTNLHFGDYFLLYLVHKNVSHLSFGDLVKTVTEFLGGKSSDTLEMGEKTASPGGIRGYYLMNDHR